MGTAIGTFRRGSGVNSIVVPGPFFFVGKRHGKFRVNLRDVAKGALVPWDRINKGLGSLLAPQVLEEGTDMSGWCCKP